MKTLMVRIVSGIFALLGLMIAGEGGRGAEFPEHPLANNYRRAADELAKALEDAKPNVQESLLIEAIDRAASCLPSDSSIAARLRNMKSRMAAGADQSEVFTALKDIVEDLRFRPIAEADLPVGFPPCTPVGEVEVKRYPGYRAAVTRDNGTAFWRLFAHIKKNNVAMTAPVEMTLEENARRPVFMAFLYERPDQGTPGEDGTVEVRDLPGGWFVSTGIRGPRSDQALQLARQRVEEWLGHHGDRWEVAGPPRLLGYNSPFIPRDKYYWEYQVPVREKSSADN
ncbi:MAG: hypothetical protein KatS3mg112_0952 [Thermogutta sp.]|nr:MAG: hypothetical protein KatS3mg112_0952 [Thermogutta sp.]